MQKEENEDDNEIDDGKTEVSYEVFYDQEQIKNTFDNQVKDVFEDIKLERFDLFNSPDGLAGLRTKNKFIIEDYAPKPPKKKFDGKSKKSKSKDAQEESDLELEAMRIREEERKERERLMKVKKLKEEKDAHKL